MASSVFAVSQIHESASCLHGHAPCLQGRILERAGDYLFDYLRDLLFDTANASLELDRLPEEFRDLGEGLIYICNCIEETKKLAKALSRGDLRCPLPRSDNEMAAPLKDLHASLKHLTWQSQQVAKGDYRQRVAFMGEFSAAFNVMVEELARRREELLEKVAINRRKSKALENANDLLESITSQLPQRVVVIDRNTGEWLFSNRPMQSMLPTEPMLDALNAWFRQWILREDAGSVCEDLELQDGDFSISLSSSSYLLQWHGKIAVAFVFQDVTQDKIRLKALEDIAYRDTATQAYNRRYGMKALEEWLNEGRDFVLCFVDIDNLKYVNDKFGHAEGDVYILRVANVLREFSSNLMLSRLGGDEFMLLAEGWSLDDATARMEHLRARLAQYNDTMITPQYYSSMSYGLVTSENQDGRPAGDLLRVADRKMYDYKRARKMQRKD